MLKRYVVFIIIGYFSTSIIMELFMGRASSIVIISFLIITTVSLRLLQRFWFRTLEYSEGEDNQIIFSIRKIPLVALLIFTSFISAPLFVFVETGFDLDPAIRFIERDDSLIFLALFFVGALFSLYIVPLVLRGIVRSGNTSVSRLAGGVLAEFFFWTGKLPIQIQPGMPIIESYLDFQKTLEKELPDTPKNRASVVFELRKRARRLQRLNALILFFTVIILVGAAIFIVFAGEIASRDTQSLSLIQTMSSSRSQIETQLANMEDEHAKLSAAVDQAGIKKQRIEIQLKEAEASTEDTKKKKERIETLRQNLDKILEKMSIDERRANLLNDRIDRGRTDLGNLNKTINELRVKSLDVGTGQLDPVTGANLLIAAGITRFGVLAITIYLVQILINLYRYNIRVAGFYLSRADALILIDHSAKKISDLSDKLTPNVNFGKQPSSLPEKVYDAFEKISEASIEKVLKKRDKNKKSSTIIKEI